VIRIATNDPQRVSCKEMLFSADTPCLAVNGFHDELFVFWLHLDGSAWIEPEATSFAPHGVQAQQMAVLGPGVRYDAQVRGQLRSLCLGIPLAVAEEAAGHPGSLATGDHFAQVPLQDDRLRLLMQSLHADLQMATPAGPLFMEYTARALVRGYLATNVHPRRATPPAAQALSRRQLSRVQELIDARLAENLSLDELAASVGLSTSHFCALFKGSTGVPPHRYLLQRRVSRACEMLRGGEQGMADLALRLGFCDQSQFTKVFRRFAGTTPARYSQELGHRKLRMLRA